jgi:hypothetical protein
VKFEAADDEIDGPAVARDSHRAIAARDQDGGEEERRAPHRS